ncbi:MAG: antitermination protein NusG, partial [Gammaproteobacteria bacterium]
AGPKALLVSRTDVMFSGPMLFMMGASSQLGGKTISMASPTAIGIVVAVIALLELNAIKGKLWPPMVTIKGVIHCSLALAVALWAVMHYLG